MTREAGAERWALFEREDSAIARHVVDQSRRCLEAYAVNPVLIRQDANIERATAQGGYGRRQIYELVQNGADALLGRSQPGRIEVALTADALYCANEGEPIDKDGVDAILTSHLSMKRGTEIGRFGLGFKSVLGVSDHPSFFSTSGSFGFDAAESETQIRAIAPSVERVPTLRLARPLDPSAEAQNDPVLSELMLWATTVVRLPRSADDTSWLGDDLREFPAEFLLFSPHVGSLTLHDRQTGLKRSITLTRKGRKFTLQHAGEATDWLVFSKNHVPSDEGKKDAGELADRESIPIIWAVPTAGRVTRGRFWAFFPTEYLTSLSGILNAPWKTNEDRQNLLPGAFNNELLDVAAELVVSSIPDLIEPDDPSRYLEAFPARGRETSNWADERLGQDVYRRAQAAASLVNQDAKPVRPSTLRIHPTGLKREWLDVWSRCPDRPSAWVHASVDHRDRRPRAERLIGESSSAASISSWLEALVDKQSARRSVAAIRLAAIIAREDESLVEAVRSARIVLTDQGTLAPTTAGNVFLAADGPRTDSLNFVHPEVQASVAAREALEQLGVGEVDAAGELEALVARLGPSSSSDSWRAFWRLTRRVQPEAVLEIVRHRAPDTAPFVRALNRRATFIPLTDGLLPGPVLDAPTGDERVEIAFDMEFHQDDLQVLRMFGGVSWPEEGRGDVSAGWYGAYKNEVTNAYYASLPTRSSRPQADYLVLAATPFPGPLAVLEKLSGAPAAVFSARVFDLLGERAPTEWLMFHRTQSRYPQTAMPAAWLWYLRRRGWLETSQGPRSVKGCLGPSANSLSDFFPVARCDERTAKLLQLAGDPIERPELWAEADNVIGESTSDDVIGRFYGFAASRRRPTPERIRCRVRDGFELSPPTKVTVVLTKKHFDALVRSGSPVVFVHDDRAANVLVRLWGLVPAEVSVRTEVRAIPSAQPIPLVDEFPMLGRILDGETLDVDLVRCEEIEVQTITSSGTTSETRPAALSGRQIFWTDGQDDAQLLTVINEALELGLTDEDCERLVAQKFAQGQRDLIGQVREAGTLAEKLITLVGADRIRRRLPAGLLEIANDSADIETTPATMALAMFGVDALKELRLEIEEAGLTPPKTWAGSTAARQFVRGLGFPTEFAGFEGARRDPILEVDGPALLPELHDYQAAIASNTRVVLSSPGGLRGLLSMPTGAGKTRVAVQAVVEAIDEGLKAPVLWIAQSDELCEQAVATWSFVWRAIGPQRRLVLSRLWSGNSAMPVSEEFFHVVVATIDKLGVVAGDASYDWLAGSAAVVIDEAHSSVAPKYTRVLDWLGLGRGRARCPLIGLTATPFRGTSETETKALASRYGRKRLDAGVLPDDPYVELQHRGVLATVEHRLLEGTDIELTALELQQLERTRLLPKSVEERLGTNRERSEMLVDSIVSLPDDWTVLLFAPSVENAQSVAALLELRGVRSAAISGLTDPGARRHYIEEFRAGRIRVLTNYNVLTQGFDAPAVRAVYVGRPTFSPNLYQQMIGRGLRGPLNGGKERCMIVNVKDNVQQYGEALAFRDFEYLWEGGDGADG